MGRNGIGLMLVVTIIMELQLSLLTKTYVPFYEHGKTQFSRIYSKRLFFKLNDNYEI